MKQYIAGVLKRWPFLYRLASRAFYTLDYHRLQEMVIGTRAREKQWAGRAIGGGYWANRDLPVMHLLADRIASYAPVGSILEIGCASGPNLYQVAMRFPDAEIRGIDINREAVEHGNMQFAREGMNNVELSVGKADELGRFPDGAFDVVFTNAVLIYIGPDKIRSVIKGMLRVARRALVLTELHLFEPDVKDTSGLGTYRHDNWVRDYAALLEQFVPAGRIRVTKIPEDIWPGEPWKDLGAIIEVTLS